MKESTSWYLFMFGGVIIFVLLGLHMITMHLDSILAAFGTGTEDVLKFQSVYERGKQATMMVFYILLLATALYHGLYGLRTILFELNLKQGLQKAITVIFSLGGIGLFVYGTYAAIAAKLM